jgi:hypothetical protein
MEQNDDYHKTYYENNKEAMNKHSKEWKKRNKDKWNAYQAAYKRRKYAEMKNPPIIEGNSE